MAGCGGTATEASSTAAPSSSDAAASAATQPDAAAMPDRELCKVTDSGGTYYLSITSAAAHNFSACDGGDVVQPLNTDVFSLDPKMDRRCMNPEPDVASEQALIAVYSGTGQDLAAAMAYCTSRGWSNG